MKKICQFCFLIILCLGLNSCVVYDTTPSKTTTRYYYGYYYGRPVYRPTHRPYQRPKHHHPNYGAHRPKNLPNVHKRPNQRR